MQCRLLNYYTWKPLVTLEHPSKLEFTDIKVYQEINIADNQDVGGASLWNKSEAARPKLICKYFACAKKTTKTRNVLFSLEATF